MSPRPSLSQILEEASKIDPDPEVAVSRVGVLIDAAHDDRDESAARTALMLCDKIEARKPPPHVGATVEYFRANAWAALQTVEGSDVADIWTWDRPEVARELLHLRKAVAHSGLRDLPVVRRCQILTNLANRLSEVGRFIEAVEQWDEALKLNPNFAMALGNRGIGLRGYARALFDPGHQVQFLRSARSTLTSALAANAHWDSGKEAAQAPKRIFACIREDITRLLEEFDEVSLDLDRDRYLGRGREERLYRRWCLEHRLFLNPLNDLWRRPLVAHDVLTLPDLAIPASEGAAPPPLIGFYNQMKQEFVSARWLLFQGLTPERPHHSDRGVLLFNTLDYPTHSLAIEKVKAAFRTAYSLLDKVALFLNLYFALGVPNVRVSFRKIWFDEQGKGRAVRHQFAAMENWPLRGLFWLARDLYEPEFKEVTDPDARKVSLLRNHLEHRFVRIHDDTLLGPEPDQGSGMVEDAPSISIDRTAFEAKALRLVQLARSALVYLSLAVRREEERRASESEGKHLLAMHLSPWDDDWKR